MGWSVEVDRSEREKREREKIKGLDESTNKHRERMRE